MSRYALLLLVLLGRLAMLLSSRPAVAATIHVPADQATVQAGIDAASAGDTVLVAPGTYLENIDFHGKAITVASSGGAGTTILDGSKGGATVSFVNGEGRSSVIAGFTITNGSASAGNGNIAGVYAGDSAPTILNNIITGNRCSGITAFSAAPLIQGNIIENTIFMQACGLGGGSGVDLQGAYDGSSGGGSGRAVPTLIGNTIQNNLHGDLYDGGGIQIFAGGAPVIENNTIRNNASTGVGGAIAMVNTDSFTLIGNLIYGNTSVDGGASIDLLIPGETTGPFVGILANNTITGNVSTGSTGGASGATFQSIGEVYIEGNLGQYAFVNNIVTSATSYPALTCGTSYNYLSITPVVIEHNDIVNSAGPGYGGACSDETGSFGNISADPQFVNAAGSDFHLRQGSPAIDTGNTSVVANLAANQVAFPSDLDDKTRVQDATGKGYPVIDMGAYEYAGQMDASATTAVLTPAQFEVAGGAPLALSAQLFSAAGTPAGSVTFFEDGNMVGESALDANATATIQTAALVPGLHSFVVTYAGQGAFTPATSVHMYVLVDKYPVTLSATSSPNPSVVNQPVTFTATVSSSDHTVPGPLVFNDGIDSPASVTPNASGVATYTATFTHVGSEAVTVSYAGDATHAAAEAVVIQTVVSGYTTSTTIASLANPANAGQAVTFVVGVSNTYGNGQTPTGTVTITDGTTVLATLPFTTSGNVGNAGLDFTTSGLAVGSHTITATYNPTSSFAGSSATVVEVINGQPTATMLTATPNPVVAFGGLQLSATTTTSGSIPSGTVTFYDGGVALGSASLNASGIATLLTSLGSAGTHTLTAVYGGSSGLSSSTSNAVTEVVTLNATATTLSVTPSPTAAAYAPITLVSSTHVPGAGGAVFPQACKVACPTVTFLSNGAVLGTATVDANGSATLTVKLPAGTDSFTASFGATSAFSSSSSNAVAETITPVAPDLLLTAQPNPALAHQAVLLTAAFGSVPVPPSAITGSMTLLDGSTALALLPVVSGGAVTFSTSTLSVGTHQITAVYSGSTSLTGASATAAVTILPQDFTITTSTPSLTIQTEHHASSVVTVTTVGSLADTIQLSCGTLPEYAHCTFRSADVTTTSDPTVTRTSELIVDTDAVLFYARNDVSQPASSRALRLALLLPMTLLGGVAFRCRRSLPRFLMLVLLSVSMTLSGCSGKYPGHTAPGTYQIDVTGKGVSSGITHTATITLVVTE